MSTQAQTGWLRFARGARTVGSTSQTKSFSVGGKFITQEPSQLVANSSLKSKATKLAGFWRHTGSSNSATSIMPQQACNVDPVIPSWCIKSQSKQFPATLAKGLLQ